MQNAYPEPFSNDVWKYWHFYHTKPLPSVVFSSSTQAEQGCIPWTGSSLTCSRASLDHTKRVVPASCHQLSDLESVCRSIFVDTPVHFIFPLKNVFPLHAFSF